jgi:hypothetical protein
MTSMNMMSGLLSTTFRQNDLATGLRQKYLSTSTDGIAVVDEHDANIL